MRKVLLLVMAACALAVNVEYLLKISKTLDEPAFIEIQGYTWFANSSAVELKSVQSAQQQTESSDFDFEVTASDGRKLYGSFPDPRVLSSEVVGANNQWVGQLTEISSAFHSLTFSDSQFAINGRCSIAFFRNGRKLKSVAFSAIRETVLDFKKAELIKLHESGSRSLSFAIMSSGYTSNQRELFIRNANTFFNYLKTVRPYSEQMGRLNVYAIYEVSQQSGASHPERGEHRNTNLMCSYNTGGIQRCLYCDTNLAARLARVAPGSDVKIAIVNDGEYGGCGSPALACSYNGGSMNRVVVHEMGHSLGLADEYDYGRDGSRGMRMVNCGDDPNNLPWKKHLGKPGIGKFPVCSYRNYYRPTENGCMMRSLQDKYCLVCYEHVLSRIINRIY